jgi:hypothetical protein
MLGCALNKSRAVSVTSINHYNITRSFRRIQKRKQKAITGKSRAAVPSDSSDSFVQPVLAPNCHLPFIQIWSHWGIGHWGSKPEGMTERCKDLLDTTSSGIDGNEWRFGKVHYLIVYFLLGQITGMGNSFMVRHVTLLIAGDSRRSQRGVGRARRPQAMMDLE